MASDSEPSTDNKFPNLPEGALPTFNIQLVSFINEVGEIDYYIELIGDASYSEIIGLLEIAKASYIAEMFDNNEED